jgi:hypothetical protein
MELILSDLGKCVGTGYDRLERAGITLPTKLTWPLTLTSEESTRLLVGLLELQPWHHDFDPTYSGSSADFFAGYRRQIQGERGLTDQQPAEMASGCGRSRRNS